MGAEAARTLGGDARGAEELGVWETAGLLASYLSQCHQRWLPMDIRPLFILRVFRLWGGYRRTAPLPSTPYACKSPLNRHVEQPQSPP